MKFWTIIKVRRA